MSIEADTFVSLHGYLKLLNSWTNWLIIKNIFLLKNMRKMNCFFCHKDSDFLLKTTKLHMANDDLNDKKSIVTVEELELTNFFK